MKRKGMKNFKWSAIANIFWVHQSLTPVFTTFSLEITWNVSWVSIWKDQTLQENHETELAQTDASGAVGWRWGVFMWLCLVSFLLGPPALICCSRPCWIASPINTLWICDYLWSTGARERRRGFLDLRCEISCSYIHLTTLKSVKCVFIYTTVSPLLLSKAAFIWSKIQ